MAKEIVTKKNKAWLVTWESYSDRIKVPEKKIISVRDSRMSSQKIWDFVQFYYASVVLEPYEIPKYPNQNNFGIVIKYVADTQGIPCSAIIHCGCGQSLFIKARIVENLIFFKDGTYSFDDFEFSKLKLI